MHQYFWGASWEFQTTNAPQCTKSFLPSLTIRETRNNFRLMIHDVAIFMNIKPDLSTKSSKNKKLNNSHRHQTCSSLLPFAKSNNFHGSQASTNLGASTWATPPKFLQKMVELIVAGMFKSEDTKPNLSWKHVGILHSNVDIYTWTMENFFAFAFFHETQLTKSQQKCHNKKPLILRKP